MKGERIRIERRGGGCHRQYNSALSTGSSEYPVAAPGVIHHTGEAVRVSQPTCVHQEHSVVVVEVRAVGTLLHPPLVHRVGLGKALLWENGEDKHPLSTLCHDNTVQGDCVCVSVYVCVCVRVCMRSLRTRT